MIEINLKHVGLIIDDNKLSSMSVLTNKEARTLLAKIWTEDDLDSLLHFMAVFYDKNTQEITNDLSFITLAFKEHGYIKNTNIKIDKQEVETQYKIDLDIINREADWDNEDAIVFKEWWPEPHMNNHEKIIEFGVVLSDVSGNVINKTINRILLTRFGHLELNYSLSEKEIKQNNDVSFYQKKLDEVLSNLSIIKPYSYNNINYEIDRPSRISINNLILSAELF